MEETDVGIVCYASSLPGFRGVLKQRYSDFIVNEVDPDGAVVHLTCIDAPVDQMDLSNGSSSSQIHDEGSTTLDLANDTYTVQIEAFRSLVGDANAELLKCLIDQISTDSNGNLDPILLSPDSDKSHRTAVHNFFKANFKFLVTDTVDGPDTNFKCVRVRFSSAKQNEGGGSRKRKNKERKDGSQKHAKTNGSAQDGWQKPFDSRGSKDWPKDIGKFLRFHLYKENKDTQEALAIIGKMLGIQQRSFGFAGTKDKRAVTTQRVTVFRQHANRLAALNDRLMGIKIGDFCYVREGLVLGQLSGNRFTIILRGVASDSEDIIKSAANGLGRHGFINYYGLQRFGSGSVPTFAIGAALLRGEWEAAVDLILDPREGERIAIKEAREYYQESEDIDGSLRRLPRHLVAERSILQCLKRSPGNYLQALKSIPRTLRLMYVHSYQSYLWNHAASSRVQKHGIDKVVVGDLVYFKGIGPVTNTGDLQTECESNTCDEEFELSGLPDTERNGENIQSVKIVDAEDINSGNYTIDDVILPLPGSRSLYPKNDVAGVYHDLAKKDGITLMESSHNVKEFSITKMTGGYRRILQRPLDFEWELLEYTDVNIPLTETDLDVLAKSKPNDKKRKAGIAEEDRTETATKCLNPSEELNIKSSSLESHQDEEDGVPGSSAQQTALKLCFTLPTSCYATMAIRELLKTSTSVAFHKTLNE
ncbi:multisubstrate pseudouridine synthase 7 isoform X1 [Amborella trichopoda]|uniref:multisubstrate pseudouridine synthase 7 isoform X1 n=1 Tax=Amborella trichopoda TaxID=13333 RepID=UPI0005D467ED|nr:multisubstrate pseudouridine synthase 7 isoform X1 [Amborella trichopoda]|eukprot:XP_011621650.1 multisubstrate pseudouridine synthase 7 isoform X1 [Amborella trichopoda]